MRVYVDTNVLVDFVCKREPFAMGISPLQREVLT